MTGRFNPLEYDALVQFLHMTLETWAAVFCLVAIIVIYPTRSIDRNSSRSCILLLFTDIILNVADVFSWVYCGLDSRFAYYASRISVFTVRFCVYLMIVLAAWHVSAVIITRGGKVNNKLMLVSVILSGIGVLNIIASQIFGYLYTFDEHNFFIRKDEYGLSILIAELAFIPVLIQTIANRHTLRRREYIGFISIHILTILGGVLQYAIEGASYFNVANSISLVTLIMIHQYEYTADVMKKEKVRADEQIRLYSRQIQPHFIFNSLSAIRSYIPEGSKARESINHFAGFLRGCIDLLTAEDCIPASREFATVNDYLYMEQERFGSDLAVVTDIEDEDFTIPAFSVLTLAENAISHGIREKEDGRGTLTIRSYMERRKHVIEVIDDGVGFDALSYAASQVPDDGMVKHIGINNVKKRLTLMCCGELCIQSKPGEGTTVRIEIPKARPSRRTDLKDDNPETAQ